MYILAHKLGFPLQITEQDIRRLAIGFLRLYYKARPRFARGGIQIVDRAHHFQGITIDARLTYIASQGKPFVATIEATSLSKRNEVDYRLRLFRLIMESLTLGLAGLAFGFWLAQVKEVNLFFWAGPTLSWWPIVLVFLLCWALAAVALQLANPPRYRYIYAIEQFKRFTADDQWVAFSAALYESHADRRFLELQRQCIRYGFGLLEVAVDRSLRVVVAPKQGDFSKAGAGQCHPGCYSYSATYARARPSPNG